MTYDRAKDKHEWELVHAPDHRMQVGPGVWRLQIERGWLYAVEGWSDVDKTTVLFVPE